MFRIIIPCAPSMYVHVCSNVRCMFKCSTYVQMFDVCSNVRRMFKCSMYVQMFDVCSNVRCMFKCSMYVQMFDVCSCMFDLCSYIKHTCDVTYECYYNNKRNPYDTYNSFSMHILKYILKLYQH